MASPDPQKRYTPAEYLAMEADALEKSDYCDGRIFHTMTPAGDEARRDQLCMNLADLLRRQLSNTSYMVADCRTDPQILPSVYGPPAVAIYRTPSNPLVVFDVLSPSSEALIRGDKASHYRGYESLEVYAIVSQHLPTIELFRRREEQSWAMSELSEMSEVLQLPFIGVALSLAELYEGIDFPSEPYVYT